MELTPGMVIAGRYRTVNRVGAGGMGEVWAGEHVEIGSRVALKTLLPAAAVNHEVVARFKREAYLLGRIRSDHVARVLDFVSDEAVGLVLVMDFIEGEPLSKILQQKTLSVEEAIELGVDIVSALRDLHHAKIIHRDLKPGNIIIQRLYDGRSRSVIVDFGVSRIAKGTAEDEEMTGITRADMAVGTIEYMAPEQILNSRDVTPTSDLYAVGAILFRAVAGHHVFGDLYDVELAKTKLTKEPTPLQTGRGDGIAKGLEEVVARALKRRPKDRYDTADRLLADLLSLRDRSRAPAGVGADMEDMETTHDVSRGSVPVYTDSTSSPSITRPRLSSASVAPGPASASASAPASASASAPASVPGRASVASITPGEPSVTLRSSHAPSRGSLSGAEAAPREPRRRAVPLAAALALVLVALAGGAGLAVALMQGKLQGLLGPTAESGPTVEPVSTADVAAAPAPSPEPSAAPSAEPTAEPASEEIDLDSPAGSARPSAAPSVVAASTVTVAPVPTAPKPAPAPTPKPPATAIATATATATATAAPKPPAPAPSPTPSASAAPTGTSTDTAEPPRPKATTSATGSPAPRPPPPSSATPAPVTNPGF